MTTEPKASQELLDLLTSSLDLVEATVGDVYTYRNTPQEALPSLYQQCLDLVDQAAHETPEPVRSLHQFACTGGTLMSKYLAATPNARLFSELDPLTTITPKLNFIPSDLILQLKNNIRPVGDQVLVDIFLAGLDVLYKHCTRVGEHLIIRDHSHSHYCVGDVNPDRMTVRAMLMSRFPTRSIVTIRHPLDSFLSLLHNGWDHFSPMALPEYARRYHMFLDDYAGVPTFQYETFVEDPEAETQKMCAALALPYHSSLSSIVPAITLTGDSGRSGTQITKRKRRDVPQEVSRDAAQDDGYRTLCARLGYDVS